MNPLLLRYSNKEVPFRFAGADLSFFLSQALFSSYEIDKGSRLLLKTLSQHIDFERIHTVMDIGCGVGTLGVSLQKRFSHLQVTMQDRDALAVAFSRINSEHNGVEGATAVGGLAFQGLASQGPTLPGSVPPSFDLTVSNIPAKVGEPVLRDMFCLILQHSRLAAVVVVHPLADYTAITLQELGAEVSHREVGSGHTVFHFRAGTGFSSAHSCTPASPFLPQAVPRADDLPAAYFRDTGCFTCGNVKYTLDTVWGLADFDTVPYQTRVTEKSLKTLPPFRRLCIWNPGQGHTSTMLAAWCAEEYRLATSPSEAAPSELQIDLMGRDMLALQISRHNLLGRQRVRSGRFFHCPGPEEAAAQLQAEDEQEEPAAAVDLFIVALEHLAGVPAAHEVLEAAKKLLVEGGTLLISGKSAHLVHFERSPDGFRPLASKKHKGYKSVVLKRV